MSEGERYEWPFDESPLKTRWRADVDEECSARHVACRTLRRGFLIGEETRVPAGNLLRRASVEIIILHQLACTA